MSLKKSQTVHSFILVPGGSHDAVHSVPNYFQSYRSASLMHYSRYHLRIIVSAVVLSAATFFKTNSQVRLASSS